MYKVKFPIMLVMLVLLVLSIGAPRVSAGLSLEKKQENESPKVNVEIVDKPSDKDKDWPIIKTERNSWVDKDSDQTVTHILVVRESPADYQFEESEEVCEDYLLTSCVKQGERTFTDSTTVGSITSHIKHWTDKICNGIDCNYNKPTKLEVWWIRSDTSWHASDAQVAWGCHGCVKCVGGDYEVVWYGDVFTPSWQSSTTSYTTRYTSSSYPALLPWDSTTDRASVDSDAYKGWQYWGHMFANAGF